MRRDLKIENIFIDTIHVPDGRRAADPEKVAALAESIKQIGLHTPITVRYTDDKVVVDGEEIDGAYVLVVGRHRYEAMKLLGEETIPAVNETDIRGARLWEIDENLMRAELSTDEKRVLIRQRKEIWDEAREESGKPVPTLGGRGNVNFAAETAAATGLSKRRINQLLADPKPRHIAVELERDGGDDLSDRSPAGRDMGWMADNDFARMAKHYTPAQLQEYSDRFIENLQRMMAA